MFQFGFCRFVESEPRWMVSAAGKAQKAVDFMLEVTFTEEPE
jgi:hypothetical protein